MKELNLLQQENKISVKKGIKKKKKKVNL